MAPPDPTLGPDTDPGGAPVPTVFSPLWPGSEGLRPSPSRVGTERELLVGNLDWHRRTFELKCSGLPAGRLSERSVEPSRLSLHGLIRHLAGVERWWFQQQFLGEPVPGLYWSDEDPEQDTEDLSGDPAIALAVWRAECERSREIVAAHPSLDATGTNIVTGEPFSLRWLLMHLLAEYARHNGHADLLRERLDGATGL
ncbi:DinB family protein [Streptomyces sp. ST2-7A]|uniref:DinB family protein n=1 Tax=Streptomyces sp. ST2-7A TaxID=2907214 RepID=UPI001F19404B|nr:DinB family protein [Streptomyces sp. ST2-7A]MCE7079109.1 DinB family protein [Streptomyces sp. ST2-7A]